MVPGGLCGGSNHAVWLQQQGDQAAVTRQWNWLQEETGCPVETNTRLNSRGNKVPLQRGEQELCELNNQHKALEI